MWLWVSGLNLARIAIECQNPPGGIRAQTATGSTPVDYISKELMMLTLEVLEDRSVPALVLNQLYLDGKEATTEQVLQRLEADPHATFGDVVPVITDKGSFQVTPPTLKLMSFPTIDLPGKGPWTPPDVWVIDKPGSWQWVPPTVVNELAVAQAGVQSKVYTDASGQLRADVDTLVDSNGNYNTLVGFANGDPTPPIPTPPDSTGLTNPDWWIALRDWIQQHQNPLPVVPQSAEAKPVAAAPVQAVDSVVTHSVTDAMLANILLQDVVLHKGI